MKPQFLLVGLGNPGKQHVRTRHNAGFLAADAVAKAFGVGKWREAQTFKSEVMDGAIDGLTCLIVKPQTYMNASGEAIVKLLRFYKLEAKTRLLVCFDDIDIELGTYRLKMSGGPGTHNGMKSIVERIGEDFPRLRIGIGPEPERMDLAAWVLSAFTEEERAKLKSIIDQMPTVVRMAVRKLRADEA